MEDVTATIEIRPAGEADAEDISALVTDLAQRHIRADCTPEGLQTLLETMTPGAVSERMMSGDFRHWLAAADGKLAGICVMRGENHLYHLFVSDDFQKRGIAKRLWHEAREDARRRTPGLKHFTVNASSYGRPAYERMGFVAEGEPMDMNGIRSQPMRLDV